MKTLQDLVNSLELQENKTLLSWKEKNNLIEISSKELYRQIINYAKGFLELGLEKGDKVAIFSSNIPEWISIVAGINH